MTVAELIEKLKVYRPTDKVVIPVFGGSSIGGSQCVSVKGVGGGFDWDAGKVFIDPEIPVCKFVKERK